MDDICYMIQYFNHPSHIELKDALNIIGQLESSHLRAAAELG